MLTVTRDMMLPTTITGSYPRPLWFDRNLDGKFRVSVVATGLDGASAGTQPRQGVALGQDMQTRTLQ